MAIIEIKSKPIQRTEFLGNLAPQHLYIVNKKDNGLKMAWWVGNCKNGKVNY